MRTRRNLAGNGRIEVFGIPVMMATALVGSVLMMDGAQAQSAATAAQEEAVRDPFSWPDLSDRLALASEDRIRSLVRDELKSFRGSIAASMRQEMTNMIASSREEIMAAIPETSTAAAGGIGGDMLQPQAIPEGARFVGCIHGRALYRDVSGTPFYFDAPTAAGVTACGVGD